MLLTACDGNTDVPYQSASYPTGERVYFTQSSQTYELTDESDASVEVTLHRPESCKGEAYTVQLLVTDPSELFDVPTSVSFAPGSTETTFAITLPSPISELTAKKKYEVIVTVDETAANEYGIATFTATFIYSRWSQWGEFGKTGDDIDNYYVFSGYYSGIEEFVKVLYRYDMDNADEMEWQFQWMIDYEDPSLGYETFLTAYTTDGGVSVNIEPQYFAYNPSYEDGIWVASPYIYYRDVIGNSTEAEKYKGIGHWDAETGLFTLSVVYYVPDLGSFGPAIEYCQMDGYGTESDATTAHAPQHVHKVSKRR